MSHINSPNQVPSTFSLDPVESQTCLALLSWITDSRPLTRVTREARFHQIFLLGLRYWSSYLLRRVFRSSCYRQYVSYVTGARFINYTCQIATSVKWHLWSPTFWNRVNEGFCKLVSLQAFVPQNFYQWKFNLCHFMC